MNKKGFSLAEMMVVMLILTVVLAAATPIITKRAVQSVKSSGGTTATDKGPFFGTCSTAADTAEKAVNVTDTALDGENIKVGTTLFVKFDFKNSHVTPTLNINGKGVNSIFSEGVGFDTTNNLSATNPAYFPAKDYIPFTYDGTGWVYSKKIVESYTNNSSPTLVWYRVYSDGWIEQGGTLSGYNVTVTVNFPKSFMNTNYVIMKHQPYSGEIWGGGLSFYQNMTATSAQTGVYDNYGKPSWYACGY